MNTAEMLEQLQAIGEETAEVPQPKPFDVNAFMAETNGMLFEHFRKLGAMPACVVCRSPALILCGLPCAAPVVVRTAQGLTLAPQLPAVPMAPLACQKCGHVHFFSMQVIAQNAQSPIVRLS